MNSRPEQINDVVECPITKKMVILLGMKLNGDIHWVNCDEYIDCSFKADCPLGQHVDRKAASA